MTSHINIIEHRKEPNHMILEIQVLTWDRHTYVAGVNVVFISLSPVENTKTGIYESLYY
jgi:hypothetical protein